MKKTVILILAVLTVVLLAACTGECNHEYGEWVVRTEPTCQAEGERYRRCLVDDCDHTESESMEKVGHDYSDEFTLDVPATATETGEKSRHCTTVGCTARVDVTEIPATGTECVEHVFDLCEKVTDPEDPSRILNLQAAATCISYARYYVLCSACLAMSGDTFDDIEAGLIPHSYSAEFTVDVIATTVMAGEKSRHCTQKGCTARTEITAIPMIVDTTGFSFSVENGEATITAYTGAALAHIVIPVTDDEGHPVVAIGDRAFAGTTSLMSIVLPRSLKRIGKNAFDGCTAVAAFYYAGSLTEWQAVNMDASNGDAINSVSLYYYNDKTPSSTDKNNYWYYNKNGVITIYDSSWTPPVS